MANNTRTSPEIKNRKAKQNFQIHEELEVGIQLAGTEVKAIREAKVHFGDAYVEISVKTEFWWVNAHIEEYSHGNINNHHVVRKRKLLAHKHQIVKWEKSINLKGMTIIPLKIYFKNGFAKMLIGLCTGKDNRDKRQDLIKQTQTREMDRMIKKARN